MDFAILADHRVKLKEGQKGDKYLGLEKLWNMKVTVIPIVIGALCTITKGLVLVLEELEIRLGDHSNYGIIEIGQNTKKSPGDLTRLAVAQTPVGNYQLTLE